jgi:hypothetical protein
MVDDMHSPLLHPRLFRALAARVDNVQLRAYLIEAFRQDEQPRGHVLYDACYDTDFRQMPLLRLCHS